MFSVSPHCSVLGCVCVWGVGLRGCHVSAEVCFSHIVLRCICFQFSGCCSVCETVFGGDDGVGQKHSHQLIEVRDPGSIPQVGGHQPLYMAHLPKTVTTSCGDKVNVHFLPQILFPLCLFGLNVDQIGSLIGKVCTYVHLWTLHDGQIVLTLCKEMFPEIWLMCCSSVPLLACWMDPEWSCCSCGHQ